MRTAPARVADNCRPEIRIDTRRRSRRLENANQLRADRLGVNLASTGKLTTSPAERHEMDYRHFAE